MCLGLNYAFKALALSGNKVDKIGSLRVLSHALPEKYDCWQSGGKAKGTLMIYLR